MGNMYCNSCCKDRAELGNLPLLNQKLEEDLPNQNYARLVKQMIQLSPKVSDLYYRYRTPHIPQRRGTKLHYYYLFHYMAYYQGDWKNGLPHGGGTLIFDDGSLYEGCFNMGEAQCRTALYIRSDGSYYKGEIKHNQANGYGQMVNQRNIDKVIYKGQWKNDLPHGEGREIFGIGTSHYDGQFVEGKKHGKGIYYWNTRQHYSGDFKENQMDGVGEHHCREYLYKGEFKKGKKHGIGQMKSLINGWKYEGQFVNGKIEGKGKYYWSDGTIFEGLFRQNHRTQEGKLTISNGKVINNPKLMKPLNNTEREIKLRPSTNSEFDQVNG